MARSILFARRASAQVVNANQSTNFCLHGKGNSSTTEEQTQMIAGVSASISNLGIYISANTITAASTYTLRIDGSNGNSTISIPSSTTGWFYDNSSIDQLSSGSLINSSLTAGSSGTSISGRLFQAVFTPETNTISRFSDLDGTSFSTSLRRYAIGSGFGNNNLENGQIVMPCNATFKSLSVYVSAFAATGAKRLQLLVNNETGSLGVLFNGTGFFYDTVNTTDVYTHDRVALTTDGGTTGNITLRTVSILAETTNNSFIAGSSYASASLSSNRHFPLTYASNTTDSTGVVTKCPLPFPVTASYIGCYINSNLTTGTSTLRTHIDSDLGSGTLSIPAGEKWIYRSASFSEPIASGSTLSYFFTRGSSDALTVQGFYILLEDGTYYTPEPPGPTGPYNIRITSQGSFPVRIHRSGNVPIEIRGTFS